MLTRAGKLTVILSVCQTWCQRKYFHSILVSVIVISPHHSISGNGSEEYSEFYDNCWKYYQIIMASESVSNRIDDKRDSQKLFRHDICSHYSAIGRSIENILHRSENGRFKENCLLLLQIDSTMNRKGTQSKKLTELLHENHSKNRR